MSEQEAPETEQISEEHAMTLMRIAELKKKLPRLAGNLLFVIAGDAEIALNVNNILQIVEAGDGVQSTIIYKMKYQGQNDVNCNVLHTVADIREEMSK